MSRISIEEILELPAAERVAQRDELERRWIAFQERPDEGEPWEDVRKSLLDE